MPDVRELVVKNAALVLGKTLVEVDDQTHLNGGQYRLVVMNVNMMTGRAIRLKPEGGTVGEIVAATQAAGR
jgi:hypothetical protein